MTEVLTREPAFWSDDELPRPSRDFDTLRSDLEVFGYGLIEDALEPGQVEAVRTRLVEQAAAERERHNMKNPANMDPVNQWVGMLLNKGEAFFDLVDHALVHSLVSDVLGPHFLISCVDAQIQHPGSVTMPLHTDQWWVPPPVPRGARHVRASAIERAQGTALDPSPPPGPISGPVEANVMWMITDFTELNGATRIVPRSHLSGQQPDPSVPHKIASVPACGRAGTAIVFDGRLWHGAGENETEQSRYGITTAYCAPQCRPLENYTRGLRPEVFERCSKEMLARLGYAAWSSYGHTGDPETRLCTPGSEAVGILKPES